MAEWSGWSPAKAIRCPSVPGLRSLRHGAGGDKRIGWLDALSFMRGDGRGTSYRADVAVVRHAGRQLLGAGDFAVRGSALDAASGPAHWRSARLSRWGGRSGVAGGLDLAMVGGHSCWTWRWRTHRARHQSISRAGRGKRPKPRLERVSLRLARDAPLEEGSADSRGDATRSSNVGRRVTARRAGVTLM